jgi:hypothetical protein
VGRLVFLAIVAALVAVAIWWVVSKAAGRPFVGDTAGKVLVALIVAALGFWLFGGGALLD